MVDFSKYRVSKDTKYRRVLVISKIASEISPKEQKLENIVISQLSNINGRIYDAIDKMWKYTKAKPPWINFMSVPSNTHENKVVALIEREGESGEYYRAFIGLKTVSDNICNTNFLENKNISHLVGIRFEKPYGWQSSNGVVCVNINTTYNNIPLIIEDIAIDIAMYYVKLAFERYSELTVEDKLQFSKSKAQFAIANNLSTYYGPILDNNINYISFASICRDSDGQRIRYDDLVKLWDNFTVSHNTINWSKYQKRKFNELEFFEDLKRNHRHYGSLDQKKLQKMLHVLGEPSNDTFYLLTTFRKPKNIIIRKQVANIFKRQIWKPYLPTFVRDSDIEKLKPWAPYILFYKFMW